MLVRQASARFDDSTRFRQLQILDVEAMSKASDTPGVNNMSIYQIRLQGQLDHRWSTWFEGLAIAWEESSVTVLTGPVADQAALYGLLRKIRDVGLPLLSITRIETNHQCKFHHDF